MVRTCGSRLLHRLFLAALLLGSLCGVRDSAAQAYCPAGGAGWQSVSYVTLTVDALTPARIDLSTLPPAPTNLAMALLTVENATLRFRFFGAPTADNGHELAPGAHFFICGRTLIEQFQAIRTSTGSQNALVHISLFQPL